MRGGDTRIQRLVRLRRAEERALQLELGQLYAGLGDVERRRGAMRLERMAALRSELRPSLEAFLARLDGEAEGLDRREESLCREAAAVQVRLERATAKVRALERLRERRVLRGRRQAERVAERTLPPARAATWEPERA